MSKLNTEAGQRKIANPAKSANNAVTKGLLISTSKGYRKISAHGEMYVEALPDLEKAKEILSKLNFRKKNTKRTKKVDSGKNDR